MNKELLGPRLFGTPSCPEVWRDALLSVGRGVDRTKTDRRRYKKERVIRRSGILSVGGLGTGSRPESRKISRPVSRLPEMNF